jgi:hypothetical protein
MKTLFLIITLSIFLSGCMNSQPTVPEEAKTALKSLQKVQAATQMGISLISYEQLLIEAKTYVNIAENKLPPVLSNKVIKDGYDFSPEYRLESINYQMQKVMDAYQAARTVWRHKISDKNLSDTPEGNAVLTNYAFIIAPNTDKDTAIQKLWDRADIHLDNLQKGIEK